MKCKSCGGDNTDWATECHLCGEQLKPLRKPPTQEEIRKEELREKNEPKTFSVMYASEKKIKSHLKYSRFDDTGVLEVSPSGLKYKSMDSTMSMSKKQIKNISKVAESSSPAAQMILAVVGLILILAIYSQKLDTNIILLLVGITIVGGALWTVVFPKLSKWTLIEYLDGSGKAKKAYFNAVGIPYSPFGDLAYDLYFSKKSKELYNVISFTLG